MLLQYAPVLLMQKLLPDVFVSGFANGIAQFATIPFLPYLNTNVSRRPALMAMFAKSEKQNINLQIRDPMDIWIGLIRSNNMSHNY